jgi:hypothetical protein
MPDLVSNTTSSNNPEVAAAFGLVRAGLKPDLALS